MKKIGNILLLFMALVFTSLNATNNYSIIPYPNKLEPKDGEFKIDSSSLNIIDPLTDTSLWNKSPYYIYISDPSMAPEAYNLIVDTNKIIIKSSSKAGFFYAKQSVQQLLRYDKQQDVWSLPCVEIEDYPRFKHRGMHLDVSRSFSDKAYILRELDALARYKMNVFHWHLTDDPGWRIEIKKYPELTRKTAYKPYSNYNDWLNGGRKFCDADTPNANGGFYTQEDVKEIVEYATARHITIIPEIEMPGHEFAALQAYPEFQCKKPNLQNSEFCVGNEETFKFLENVLDEILELFPSKYIHVGGDEVWQKVWLGCPDCMKRMETEHLTDVAELQSYFITRIGKYLKKNGRILIGWDEILQGGLAPDAVVHSWQGEDGGIKAVQSNHYAIMAPGSHCYFDSFQDAPHKQPKAVGGYTPLLKVYSYNPVPSTISAKQESYILGVQGQVWTELMPTFEHREYMTYPRLLAIGEIGWTEIANKDYKRFRAKAVEEVRRMEKLGYHPFPLYNEIGDRPEFREPVKHLALGKKVIYNTAYSDYYVAQGASTLTDGLSGNWSYTDGRWQGWLKSDIDVVIDLESEIDIKEISTEYMQMTCSGVWIPKNVEISISNDLVNFKRIFSKGHSVPENDDELTFLDFKWEGAQRARYIRVKATNAMPVKGWLFLSEIKVF